jgi:hypothetical protein
MRGGRLAAPTVGGTGFYVRVYVYVYVYVYV